MTAATIGSRGDATLVLEAIKGETLDQMQPEKVTDEQLVDTWTQLSKLHDAGITHGGIWAKTFVLSGTGASFSDLATANTRPDFDAYYSDRVALLATLADLVGDDRAIAAAQTSLGKDGLSALLPYLQTTRFLASTADQPMT